MIDMWRKLPWLLLLIVGILIIVMVAVALWLLQQQNDRSDHNAPDQTLLDEREERSCGLPSAESVAATKIVQMNSAGFNPSEVAIQVGETIRWENNDSSPHRIVVGPHPLHNNCLGLDSKELAPDESFGFTFTKPGELIVHDEHQPSSLGKIVVTE